MALDVGVAGRTGRDHVLAAQRAGDVEVGAIDAVTGQRATRNELAVLKKSVASWVTA